jgi:hypothetical protein
VPAQKKKSKKQKKKKFQENFFNYKKKISPLAYFSHMAVIGCKGGWEV